MKYTISPDRKTLTIKADSEDRERIALIIKTGENEQGVTCDMYDIFEPITSNSELEWITGDLKSAPILGIYGEERPFHKEDASEPHRITGPNLIQEVEERWGFQPYQLRSPLEDLRDKGEAVFSNSW